MPATEAVPRCSGRPPTRILRGSGALTHLERGLGEQLHLHVGSEALRRLDVQDPGAEVLRRLGATRDAETETFLR